MVGNSSASRWGGATIFQVGIPVRRSGQPMSKPELGLMMSRPKFPVFLSIVFCLLVVNSAYSAQKPSAAKKTVDPAPQVQQEVPPPAPLTPEQMPAVAPQVSYQNGKLTIVARNSTLGDILRAVKARTGAEVDLPGNVTERVVGQFGPGESRDVVASLLNGSHFNYVMMASETNPNQLKTLIVTSKASSAPESSAPTAGNQPQPQPAPQVQAQESTDASADDFVDDNNATDDQQVADQPVDDQQQQAPQVNISPNGQVQPNVKTPEQLLQELQQRQQQIQQQQQQQPGAAPPQGAPQGFPIPPQGSGPN